MKRIITILIMLIAMATAMKGVWSYNTHYHGTIIISDIRPILNSVPGEYYRGLDSIHLFEENCLVKMYNDEKQYFSDNGWYYYEYDYRNHLMTTEIYLCNLAEASKDRIHFALSHELAHHFEIYTLKHRYLNDTFADNWFKETELLSIFNTFEIK